MIPEDSRHCYWQALLGIGCRLQRKPCGDNAVRERCKKQSTQSRAASLCKHEPQLYKGHLELQDYLDLGLPSLELGPKRTNGRTLESQGQVRVAIIPWKCC